METRPAEGQRAPRPTATARLHASGSETARLDAEVLLGYVLGVDRSVLAAHPEAVLSTGQLEAFEACLARRERGEPVAYIRGLKEFYGVAISVDPRVLIPRPETETLVELAIERIRADLTGRIARPAAPSPTSSGTWAPARVRSRWPSGCELRRRRYGDAVHFHVSDLSADARDVATINAVSHGLADLFTFA